MERETQYGVDAKIEEEGASQRNLRAVAAPALKEPSAAEQSSGISPAQTMTMEIGQFSIILLGSKASTTTTTEDGPIYAAAVLTEGGEGTPNNSGCRFNRLKKLTEKLIKNLIEFKFEKDTCTNY